MPDYVQMVIPPYYFPGASSLPCKIEQIAVENGLIVKWIGKVDEQEVIQVLRKHFNPLERFAKLSYILADCSGITECNISPRTIQTIAQIYNQVASFNKNLYFVWVMPSDLLFALGRMWQSYTDDGWNGWRSRVTRSRQEAEEWLCRILDGGLGFGCDDSLPAVPPPSNQPFFL